MFPKKKKKSLDSLFLSMSRLPLLLITKLLERVNTFSPPIHFSSYIPILYRSRFWKSHHGSNLMDILKSLTYRIPPFLITPYSLGSMIPHPRMSSSLSNRS